MPEVHKKTDDTDHVVAFDEAFDETEEFLKLLPPKLRPQQRLMLDWCKTNVAEHVTIVAGGAGTGKSSLLASMIEGVTVNGKKQIPPESGPSFQGVTKHCLLYGFRPDGSKGEATAIAIDMPGMGDGSVTMTEIMNQLLNAMQKHAPTMIILVMGTETRVLTGIRLLCCVVKNALQLESFSDDWTRHLILVRTHRDTLSPEGMKHFRTRSKDPEDKDKWNPQQIVEDKLGVPRDPQLGVPKDQQIRLAFTSAKTQGDTKFGMGQYNLWKIIKDIPKTKIETKEELDNLDVLDTALGDAGLQKHNPEKLEQLRAEMQELRDEKEEFERLLQEAQDNGGGFDMMAMAKVIFKIVRHGVPIGAFMAGMPQVGIPVAVAGLVRDLMSEENGEPEMSTPGS